MLWLEDFTFKIVDVAKLKSSEKYKKRRYTDAKYFGEVNSENQREGSGIMLYLSTRYYEGEWRNDLRNGFGREIYDTGNIYEG